MKYIKILLVCIVFFGIIIFLGHLVSYKYISLYPEGSFISDYYKEENNHDVIFLGDCEAYTTFSPINLYKNYGITSYVRGNSQQLINGSYYVLKETLKYEKPKVVVLSVGLMRYDKQVKEEYNRLLLDKMKWSREKIDLIKTSMLEEESFLSYLFPLLRYHDRITKLTKDDFKYLFNDKQVSHNGFIINQNVKALTTLPSKKTLSNYNFSTSNMDYLKKIYLLCKENNITLVLEKSPTMYPFWYQEYDRQIKEFASTYNIDYYNLLEKRDEIGLDFNFDTYDSGVHLNLKGAEKVSRYFGKILSEKYSLQDYRFSDKIKLDYEKKLERYYGEINEKNN